MILLAEVRCKRKRIALGESVESILSYLSCTPSKSWLCTRGAAASEVRSSGWSWFTHVTAGLGGGTARRLLSAGSNLSLAVYEDSEPFLINLTNISVGGWEQATNLSYSFSFSQAPLPLVEDISFDSECYDNTACSARVTLYPSRHGVTTLAVTIKNSGGRFTPLGSDSYSVKWELTVVNINNRPSFVLSTAALNVDEDSSCVIS